MAVSGVKHFGQVIVSKEFLLMGTTAAITGVALAALQTAALTVAAVCSAITLAGYAIANLSKQVKHLTATNQKKESQCAAATAEKLRCQRQLGAYNTNGMSRETSGKLDSMYTALTGMAPLAADGVTRLDNQDLLSALTDAVAARVSGGELSAEVKGKLSAIFTLVTGKDPKTPTGEAFSNNQLLVTLDSEVRQLKRDADQAQSDLAALRVEKSEVDTAVADSRELTAQATRALDDVREEKRRAEELVTQLRSAAIQLTSALASNGDDINDDFVGGLPEQARGLGAFLKNIVVLEAAFCDDGDGITDENIRGLPNLLQGIASRLSLLKQQVAELQAQVDNNSGSESDESDEHTS